MNFSSDAMALLTKLPYSGNIRELKNIVERTIIISGKQTLTADDFEPQINSCSRTTTINSDGLTLDDMERHSIIASLKKHNNNLSHVALDLGLSRAALYRRLEKYDINNRTAKKGAVFKVDYKKEKDGFLGCRVLEY